MNDENYYKHIKHFLQQQDSAEARRKRMLSLLLFSMASAGNENQPLLLEDEPSPEEIQLARRARERNSLQVRLSWIDDDAWFSV